MSPMRSQSGPVLRRTAAESGDPSDISRRKAHATTRIGKTNPPKIEICCLGHFAVRHTSATSPLVVRTHSRPAELLYLLIAVGPHGVDKEQAMAMLWPDAQTALANSTLDTTLYRLRKQLGSQRVLRVRDGVMALDDDHVSVDVWNFAREADALHARLQASGDELDPGEIAIRCERLLDHYHGSFLVAASALPWIVQARDQLQAKFLRVVKQAGAYWQAADRWDRAAKLYERALELNNLSEELYRELMRCHFARGQFAETVNVFRRCRELLSTVLDVIPSAETETLYRQALAAQP